MNRGITTCEIKLEGCKNSSFLGFAHRHKRRWYKHDPKLLEAFNQTILACASCHDKIEYNKELTELTFRRLRGEEQGI